LFPLCTTSFQYPESHSAIKMFGSLSTVIALLAVKVAGTIYYAGVAESGGEFGVYSMSRHSWGDHC
jgi:hypothetical protein